MKNPVQPSIISNIKIVPKNTPETDEESSRRLDLLAQWYDYMDSMERTVAGDELQTHLLILRMSTAYFIGSRPRKKQENIPSDVLKTAIEMEFKKAFMEEKTVVGMEAIVEAIRILRE